MIPKLCKSNIFVDELLENSLEIATKFNLYLSKKHFKKICVNTILAMKKLSLSIMKGFGEKNQSKKEKISKNKPKINTGQLIKKAFDLQAQGRKLEAAKYY